MRGLHPNLCMHHIYTKDDCRPIRKPQRIMNPALGEVVNDELQKFPAANFIYPISDSKWVSLLVIVLKKNGKWCIYVDYREMIKATHKDHFPLPLIDKVLDMLAGKKYFSFMDGFNGYNQISIASEDHRKNDIHMPMGNLFIPCSTFRIM